MVGDRVTHVDYPRIRGTVVFKMKRWGGETQKFMVLWDTPRPSALGGNVRTSRHIWSSLRQVQRPR